MTVSRQQQDQIHTQGSSINDGLTPSDHDANAVDLQDTLDYFASQILDITGKTNWEDSPDATIATIWAKTFLDEKLADREVQLLTDITVPSSQNYKILSVAGSEVPSSPSNLKAIALTTVGYVTAQHGATFGTHDLAEVTGGNALGPENLLAVVDGTTGDPILSSGRRIWALLQHEATATDGAAFTDTTPQRAQVSFVRANATFDDLEACPVADIENAVVNLHFVHRDYLDSWNRYDFLRRTAAVDVGAAASAVTLNDAIDNQGATPATQVTDIFVRIDDDSVWNFADSTGAKNILRVMPAAAGDEVEINADTLDINVGASGVVDIDNGATVDSGGQAWNLGVTAGQLDSATAKIKANSGALELEALAGTMILDAVGQTLQADAAIGDLDFTDDSHLIMGANNAAAKTLLIAARNSGAGAGNLELEADDDILFETVRETTPLPLDDATAGAISALTGGPHASISAAIAYAMTVGGVDLTFDIFVAGTNYNTGVNIPAATQDLTNFDGDMGTPGSPGTPDIFLFLNGRLVRGAAASGTGDWYPGDTPASGDIKVDFPKGIKSGDVILTIALKA